ncbi:potassium channel family protein [Blastococcus litoris]|uniref:potassium channel family protein n=1 Tax=Blastococcus litoris TaxID=2171622 RepID=UPI0013E09E7E|nr:potassium channel family protein [Blastococcus litoris]
MLLVLVLRDVFHTLFHPAGQGSLSRLILSGTWRVARWVGGPTRLAELAGPLGVVAVIGTWGGAVVLGGALVYWPYIDQFSYSAGLNPDARADFLDALYLSLTTTSTLGFGDLVPTEGWLRVATPIQALLGFSLLTAAVTWVLQVYPALNRRRTLATRLTTLDQSGFREALPHADSAMAAILLSDLAGQVAQMRVDLTQYAETYYFRSQDARSSMPATLPYALDLVSAGRRSGRADVRLAATHLACALEDLAEHLRREFVQADGDVEEVLAAYAREHGETTILGRADATGLEDQA